MTLPPHLIYDLESLGLSETEARIYMALLSRGTSSVRDIAFDSGVKRTTVYPALDSLREKGLVTLDITRGKRSFVLTPIASLQGLVRDKIASFESTLQVLSRFESGQIKTRQVQHFRGLKAVEGAYESMLARLKPGHFYWAIGHQDRWLASDRKFFINFKRRRAQLKIDVRLLLVPSSLGGPDRAISTQLGEQIRFLSESARVSSNTVVTPFCYLLHSLEATPTVLLVEIPAIVESQLEYFRLLWNSHRE